MDMNSRDDIEATAQPGGENRLAAGLVAAMIFIAFILSGVWAAEMSTSTKNTFSIANWCENWCCWPWACSVSVSPCGLCTTCFAT